MTIDSDKIMIAKNILFAPLLFSFLIYFSRILNMYLARMQVSETVPVQVHKIQDARQTSPPSSRQRF